MKKISLFLLQSVLAGLLLSSCVDLDDIYPTDRFSDATVWESEETVDSYTIGFYSAIRDVCQTYSGVMTDAYSDILKSTDGDETAPYNRALLTSNWFTSTNAGSLDKWGNYDRIKRQNEFLYAAPTKGAQFGKEFIDTRIAEVKFIRAYSYFEMARVYGGVIIRDETNGVDGPEQKDKARATEEETWEFIMKDLKEAAEVLPIEWPGKWQGRVTKGAAYAMLCRCALYAKKWDIAIQAANEVEKCGADLLDNYEDVFKVANNKELLLAMNYAGNFTHGFDKTLCPPGDGAEAQCDYVPTADLVNSYEMSDGKKFDWSNPEHDANPYVNREPRFYASILYNGANWKGRKIEVFEGGKDGYQTFTASGKVRATVTGYYVKKFLDESVTDLSTMKSTQFDIVLRYAEVLLNKAEALAEQNFAQNKTEALAALNRIRTRVHLPEKEEADAPDKAAFMELVRQERKVELAFEGFRYWDIRRWRLGMELINGKQAQAHKPVWNEGVGRYVIELHHCDAGKDRYFAEKFYYMSVPEFERLNNTLCKNNPYW